MNSTQRFTHVPLIPVLGALGLGLALGLAAGMHIRNNNFVDNKSTQSQIIQTPTQEDETLEQRTEDCQLEECKFDLPKPVYDFITQKANGGVEKGRYTVFDSLERDSSSYFFIHSNKAGDDNFVLEVVSDEAGKEYMTGFYCRDTALSKDIQKMCEGVKNE